MADMSTCESCGVTEPTDQWHEYYGSCGECVQDVPEELRRNPLRKNPSVNNQQAESNHPEVPRDRANDPARRPGV